ncbi:MAG: hypothetical protein GWO07_07420 [Candidatus Dadabacteria bacterium]|nr:hypothetical protein [Candidatus Dadabacteria bacterium]
MKKLLTVAALGLALNLPIVGYADTNIFGVDTPIEKQQVSEQVKGGKVEQDHISFYLQNQDQKNIEIDQDAQARDNISRSELSVFGVNI